MKEALLTFTVFLFLGQTHFSPGQVSAMCCSTTKLDWSCNTVDTYLVESWGYFLTDKPSSVPESNLNLEDESESNKGSVA